MATTQTRTLKRQVIQYLGGFVSALGLTVLAFWLAMSRTIEGGWLVAALVVLAVIQLGVQLVFFLHVGNEEHPRWNMTALIFMLVMLIVIVAGSIWIMNNLNYNMGMTAGQMDAYMKSQRDKGF